jgi:hypothetical protein
VDLGLHVEASGLERGLVESVGLAVVATWLVTQGARLDGSAQSRHRHIATLGSFVQGEHVTSFPVGGWTTHPTHIAYARGVGSEASKHVIPQY